MIITQRQQHYFALQLRLANSARRFKWQFNDAWPVKGRFDVIDHCGAGIGQQNSRQRQPTRFNAEQFGDIAASNTDTGNTRGDTFKGTSINSEPPKGTAMKTIAYGAIIDHLWY
jgi:hypothetical protein